MFMHCTPGSFMSSLCSSPPTAIVFAPSPSSLNVPVPPLASPTHQPQSAVDLSFCSSSMHVDLQQGTPQNVANQFSTEYCVTKSPFMT